MYVLRDVKRAPPLPSSLCFIVPPIGISGRVCVALVLCIRVLALSPLGPMMKYAIESETHLGLFC